MSEEKEVQDKVKILAKIKILRDAREFVEYNGAAICASVERVSRGSKLKRQAGNEITDAVMNSLGGHLFYGTWLKENHPEFWHVLPVSAFGVRDLMPGRLAWIDDMIAHLEAQL